MLRRTSAPTLLFIMGRPTYDSDVIPAHKNYSCPSIFLRELQRSLFGVTRGGLKVQDYEQRGIRTPLRKNPGVLTEQSELHWSESGRRSNGFDTSLNLPRRRSPTPPVVEGPRSSPCVGHRNCQRIAPEISIAGCKRRTEEMEIPQECIHGHCSSRVPQEPSSKLRKSCHEKKLSDDGACGSSTNCKNSTGDGCDNPTTSTSNSCPKKQTKVKSINPEKTTASGWDSLPTDLLANILLRVDFRNLFCCKTLSKSCKEVIEDDSFQQTWRSEGSYAAINYYIKDDTWRCSAYDLHSKSWKAFKPFSFLPAPNVPLFKEYSVTGHGGLMCADVSKLPNRGHLVVFNPLTGENRALPPLRFPRNPVLVHLIVDSVQRSFKVVVAGSSAASDRYLSTIVEVFDSSTSAWTQACDLPGPAFGLNEHQAGVCLNGSLFFISFLEGDCRKGVIAFDVAKKEWLKNLACPIPYSSSANTLQLVESDGKVYLFSELYLEGDVEHCIDELEFPDPDAGAMSCSFRNVVRVKKAGGRALQVYPKICCVGFGEEKLCIFNALNRTGVVYEMREGKQCAELQAPPEDQMGKKFSLNPPSFSLQPNFAKLGGGTIRGRRLNGMPFWLGPAGFLLSVLPGPTDRWPSRNRFKTARAIRAWFDLQ